MNTTTNTQGTDYLRPTVHTEAGWIQTHQTLDGLDFQFEYLGDGNWEADTPAGVFEIVSTSDHHDPATDSVAVFGPNHHYPDQWFDTGAEVVDYLRRNGSDARTTRHLATV